MSYRDMGCHLWSSISSSVIGAPCSLEPLGVERTRHVDPLVGVSPKVVPLRLHQVGGQPVPAVRVKVGQASGHARGANTIVDGKADHPAPCRLPVHDLLRELRVHEEVGEVGVPVVGLLDAVEEDGADDAPSLPDPR
uniref:Pgd2 n=1 Tax=Arundo donax TaxID=35708 RepID=A0A0A9EVS4_ARUDO